MSVKKKYYTVWKWKEVWVFDSWEDCKKCVEWFSGAEYKSFDSRDMAEKALSASYKDFYKTKDTTFFLNKDIPFEKNSIAVDAACSGNPGIMEYRWVDLQTWLELFYEKFDLWTNNIWEFLAIVHGISYLQKQNKTEFSIYTDSKTAIQWVKSKKCRTTISQTKQTQNLMKVIQRAEDRLKNNNYTSKIIKRDTENWWEIPADFGRK